MTCLRWARCHNVTARYRAGQYDPKHVFNEVPLCVAQPHPVRQLYLPRPLSRPLSRSRPLSGPLYDSLAAGRILRGHSSTPSRRSSYLYASTCSPGVLVEGAEGKAVPRLAFRIGAPQPRLTGTPAQPPLSPPYSSHSVLSSLQLQTIKPPLSRPLHDSPGILTYPPPPPSLVTGRELPAAAAGIGARGRRSAGQRFFDGRPAFLPAVERALPRLLQLPLVQGIVLYCVAPLNACPSPSSPFPTRPRTRYCAVWPPSLLVRALHSPSSAYRDHFYSPLSFVFTFLMPLSVPLCNGCALQSPELVFPWYEMIKAEFQYYRNNGTFIPSQSQDTTTATISRGTTGTGTGAGVGRGEGARPAHPSKTVGGSAHGREDRGSGRREREHADNSQRTQRRLRGADADTPSVASDPGGSGGIIGSNSNSIDSSGGSGISAETPRRRPAASPAKPLTWSLPHQHTPWERKRPQAAAFGSYLPQVPSPTSFICGPSYRKPLSRLPS